MSDCTQALTLVEKLSDGEATAAEKRAAEAHLERCTSCRSHYQFLVSLAGLARDISFPEPPESYWEHLPRKVLSRIESDIVARPRSGFFRALFAPPVIRWGALGATLVALLTVGIAVLEQESPAARPMSPPSPFPPPAPAAEEPLAAEPAKPPAQASSDEALPPPMARDEAPRRAEKSASEAAAPAVAPASSRAFEANEVVRARDLTEPELRKENGPTNKSAPETAVAAPAAVSRLAAPMDCDALRRSLHVRGAAGAERELADERDTRYRLATCSFERYGRGATDELRALAIEDAEAFLAVEGDGPRADEVRGRLAQVRRH